MRTAYFSSARKPGVVFRVHARRAVAHPANHGDEVPGGGRDAGQMAEQVERRALGRQERPGGTLELREDGAGCDVGAVTLLDPIPHAAEHLECNRAHASPHTRPSRRATTLAVAGTLRWTIASVVISPAEPRSTASSLRTRSS